VLFLEKHNTYYVPAAVVAFTTLLEDEEFPAASLATT
jgi:hypothetical protein